MSLSIADVIKAARPGFWVTHLWFYLLPLGGYHLLDQPTFWLGAVYVMFPLGLLLYGWNDCADFENDQLNSRKDSWLFGARLTRESLAQLPWAIAAVQLPFFAAFLWIIGPKFLLWILAALVMDTCYNWPKIGFKNWWGLDLATQSGYLLVFVLASWLNKVPQLPWPAMLFGLLFAMHSHILGEIPDIEADRATGRRTTAVVIGAMWSKVLIGIFLLVEASIVASYFNSQLLVVFLSLAGVGFVGDSIVRRDTLVSDRTLAAIFVAWNLIALASMYFVWREAIFVG